MLFSLVNMGCACVYEKKSPDPYRCIDNFRRAWNEWLWAKDKRIMIKSEVGVHKDASWTAPP